ncbi:MAG: hypothetical protein AAF827_01405 [Cyanobacteria bacterium P01_D01_bin.6]
MVAALMQMGEVDFTRWVAYIPCRGHYVQGKQRCVRRWLGNSQINIYRLYKPIIQAALAAWQEERLYFNLDTSRFWDQYCLLHLAMVYRGRVVLPLTWRVLKHESVSVSFRDDTSDAY